MRRLYIALCKRWAEGGITLSAWAWKHFLLTGNTWPRNAIDGLWMIVGNTTGHCQSSYQTWLARRKGLIE